MTTARHGFIKVNRYAADMRRARIVIRGDAPSVVRAWVPDTT